MALRGRPRSFDRDEVLRRAMALFWEKGYQGASLADLTMAMGINSPSLYAAFRSKAKLFREAVELYWEINGARTWKLLPDSLHARDAFDTLLRATATGITKPGKPRGCLIILGHVRADDDAEMVGDELRRLRAHMLGLLRERLERAAREGELPAEVDATAMAAFYSTVHQGLSLQARDGASRKMLLDVVRCAMAAWDGLARSVVKTR
jgi:AcrR family transcriptional regulator